MEDFEISGSSSTANVQMSQISKTSIMNYISEGSVSHMYQWCMTNFHSQTAIFTALYTSGAVASYLELYKEGAVEHISGPTNPLCL